MWGIDNRLVTPQTKKYVWIGLTAGILLIPTTIGLYYILGLLVDELAEGGNLLQQWFWIIVVLIIAKAILAWIFRTGQFRASSEAKLNVRDQSTSR